MTPLLLAAAIVVMGPPSDVTPLPWAVCVTTVEYGGVARFDSYWSDRQDARARRAEILASGWVATGDDGSEEDAYPASSILKATVDGTDDESICQSATLASARVAPRLLSR